MKMKRGLVFTLCAMAVAASATIAQAQTIDLSLNLRYTDPADPSEGGVWYLTGKTSGGATNLGIASVSAWINNINPTIFHGSAAAAGNGYPAVTQATIKNIGDADNGNNPFGGVFGTATNVLYGQDTTTVAGIQGGVGTGGASAGNVAVDPLRNTAFNNYAVLLSGTFGATRPAFAPLSGNTVTGGSVLASTTVANTPSIAATIAAANLKVRGDSLASLGLNTPANAGLIAGDANRSGQVTSDDFDLLAFNFGKPNANTWGQGDFNDSGTVTSDDFDVLAFNFGKPAPPAPALAGVPEPSSFALIALCSCGLYSAARKRS
jgi:hypothetical protein